MKRNIPRSAFPILLAAGLIGSVAFPGATPARASAVPQAPPLTTTEVSRSDFGINVFSYDSQLAGAGAVTALRSLGTGVQQFPNSNQWNWVTDTSKPGGWQYPVSLSTWGQVLTETGNQGIYIFNYDENTTWTGGGSPADATAVTQYIVSHHLPIDAIVIGSEEYGSWDFTANLNPRRSAAYYGQHADAIAKAIHAVDPQMKVGIVFDPGEQAADRAWNQTVLRDTAQDINFISLHDYPEMQPLSDAALLARLPQDITQEMTYAKDELALNTPPGSNIGIWVTEFNPYWQPTAQSTRPVYGAAIIESLITFRALGAQRVVLWSFDGQAHSTTAPNYPVASASDSQYALFALAGDGVAPEIQKNAFYPSAQAVAEFMQAIGSGAKLSTWIGNGVVVGQVQSGSSLKDFFINESATAKTLQVNGHSITLAATGMTTTTASAPILSLAPFQSATYATTQHTTPTYAAAMPSIDAAPLQVTSGEAVTVRGSGFGAQGHGYVFLTQQNTNNGSSYDGYNVPILAWSPTAITFRVPDGSQAPALQAGVRATVQIVTSNGLLTQPQSLGLLSGPTLASAQDGLQGTALASEAATASYTPPPDPTIAAASTSGKTLTITGSGFGAKPPLQAAHDGGVDQPLLLIHDQANGCNYGYDGTNGANWYGIHITTWTNTRIVLQFGPTPPAASDHLELSFPTVGAGATNAFDLRLGQS